MVTFREKSDQNLTPSVPSTGPAPGIPETRKQNSLGDVSDQLDIPAMLERFRERAKAVRNRPMPPVEGAERKRFMDRAQTDFMDFAIIGDAEGTIEDGVLTLRVDLRPKP
jgi:hypothetical protein